MKYLLAFLLGWLSSVPVYLYFHDEPTPPPALEFEAYRLCMQSAGTTGCQMTPQDFVRYYELKHQLEIEDE